MIFDISGPEFRSIFQDKELHLPIRWDGNDFIKTLDNIFRKFCKSVCAECCEICQNCCKIETICDLIKMSVRQYLDGFPAEAYNIFCKLMYFLQKTPLKVYKKSSLELFESRNDKLNLFRVASVDENRPYGRTRIFHTPYNLRAKVSTSRYSIAGYPSLYLGTSLELCCEEVQYNSKKAFAIASKFKIERNIEENDTMINVIELALKPQDFFEEERGNDFNYRRFDEIDLSNKSIRYAYLLWYPLIASCSFIRVNKSDPFASEYIIPQLLMQWVRSEMAKHPNKNYKQLIGIRYFSCASVKASDMGFNYVFPVSGKRLSKEFEFCPILARAFRLTKPHYVNEYFDVAHCEKELKNDNDLQFVDT